MFELIISDSFLHVVKSDPTSRVLVNEAINKITSGGSDESKSRGSIRQVSYGEGAYYIYIYVYREL